MQPDLIYEFSKTQTYPCVVETEVQQGETGYQTARTVLQREEGTYIERVDWGDKEQKEWGKDIHDFLQPSQQQQL